MSDTKHTPLPWKIEGTSICGTWETGESVQIASMSTTHWSTDPRYDDVEANHEKNKRMRRESIANMSLFFAAPALLEACKEALPILGREFPFCGSKAYKQVSAAIAAAEREEDTHGSAV